MEEIRIRNWNELNDAVFRGSWSRLYGRFRGPYVFRGMSDASSTLGTSLVRLGGAYEQVEGSLVRNFRKYGHRSAVSRESFWHWLVVAQHHGLPTRLLDWTYSPHIAAHFATEQLQNFTVDGVVWCVDMAGVHKFLPPELRHFLESEHADVFTTEMLDAFAGSLSDFDERLEDLKEPIALFLEPPSIDERIVNQLAVLSLMSSPTASLDDWLEEAAPHLARKVIIPASAKLEIRDKLDMININERMIYPGLDGLSRWLRRYYSPLNLIEVTYPAANDAREDKYVGVIQRVSDGVLEVKLLADGAQGKTTQIGSRDDGCWYDIAANCRIVVRTNPDASAYGSALQSLRSEKQEKV